MSSRNLPRVSHGASRLARAVKRGKEVKEQEQNLETSREWEGLLRPERNGKHGFGAQQRALFQESSDLESLSGSVSALGEEGKKMNT